MTGKVRRAASEWVRDLTLNGVASSALVPASLRWAVLRALGLDVAPSRVAGRCFFGGRGVKIGRGAFVNYGCFFDTTAPVHIGDGVSIGMQASFLTGTHHIGDARCRAGASVGRPITVGAGAWVGAGATVLPGVTIGEGAVVGAGALVTRDVEPHTVVAGVPARVLRTLG